MPLGRRSHAARRATRLRLPSAWRRDDDGAVGRCHLSHLQWVKPAGLIGRRARASELSELATTSLPTIRARGALNEWKRVVETKPGCRDEKVFSVDEYQRQVTRDMSQLSPTSSLAPFCFFAPGCSENREQQVRRPSSQVFMLPDARC